MGLPVRIPGEGKMGRVSDLEVARHFELNAQPRGLPSRDLGSP